MDIIQKLRSAIGFYTPVKKQDVSSRYPNHEMSSFIKIIQDINWSRGYSWFVEMEDAPPPFDGSALGLPVTDITFVDVIGEEFSWDSSTWKHYVPKCRGGEEEINLTLIDDEQATIYTFFDNWMNDIYDPYNGVLPLTEACKRITIHRLTSERYRVNRDVNGAKVEGYTYYVYPINQLTETLSGEDNGPVKLQVPLRIVSHTDLKSTVSSNIMNRVRNTVDQNFEYIPY